MPDIVDSDHRLGGIQRWRTRFGRGEPPGFSAGGTRMSRTSRFVVGLWLFAVSLLSVAGIYWAWTEVEQVEADGRPVSAHWLVASFPVSADTGLLALVAFAAIAGSAVHCIVVFSERAGRRTLERDYLWWYLLRPLGAALLGVLFYFAVRAGLMTLGAAAGPPSPAAGATVGALAGLFTDRVLQQMGRVLGSTDPATPASAQAPRGRAARSRPVGPPPTAVNPAGAPEPVDGATTVSS